MSTEKLSTLSFRKQWRVLLEYRSDISLSYPKSWVSILGGDNLLCVEEDNIYHIQRTNNHFNTTSTTLCIWTKITLYAIFCCKLAYGLDSAPTQDKFLDLYKTQFCLHFKIRNLIQKTLRIQYYKFIACKNKILISCAF